MFRKHCVPSICVSFIKVIIVTFIKVILAHFPWLPLCCESYSKVKQQDILVYQYHEKIPASWFFESQSAFTCSKLSLETPKQCKSQLRMVQYLAYLHYIWIFYLKAGNVPLICNLVFCNGSLINKDERLSITQLILVSLKKKVQFF